MTNEKIRMILADDHTLLRNGIVSMLENVPNIYIAGEACNGRELVVKYFECLPDVVVTDISMPKLSGIEAAEKILVRDKNAKILFLSVNDSEDYIYKTLKLGALGLVNKTIARGDLIFAIETVYGGKRYFGRTYTEEKLLKILDKYEATKEENITNKTNLTHQEFETLRLICEGLQSSGIADKMFLSKKTVDKHRSSIMKKFNVSNIAQLIRFVYKNNIIE